MVRIFGQAVPLEKPPAQDHGAPQQTPAAAPTSMPKARSGRMGRVALMAGSVLSLFWVGVTGAYAWGFWGEQGLLQLPLAAKAALSAAMLMPPFLFMAV